MVTDRSPEARHGRDCPKVQHVGEGYLHGADDDRPYDVDGVKYCGRCHGWIGLAVCTCRHDSGAFSECVIHGS